MLNTKTKIKIAATLSTMVRTLRAVSGAKSESVLVKRDGIAWCLDLKEGIDFAIFLRLYERSTTKAIRQAVRPGQIVLDIGANIGAHTLELGRRVGPKGKVFAFEPTSFAYSKLIRNLSLNADLLPIVRPEQLLLAGSDSKIAEAHIHSSWPLVKMDDLHKDHLGRLQSTEGSSAISLDSYLSQTGVERVDFIKLDVDGFECEVFEGAHHCLETFRPTILMELAPYVLRERGSSLAHLLSILNRARYRFWTLEGEELGADVSKLDRRIPEGSSINVFARTIS